MSILQVPINELCDISIPKFEMNNNDLCDLLSSHIKENYAIEDDQIKIVKEKILQYFIPNFRKKWTASFHQKDVFESRCSKWLLTELTFTINISNVGRRSLENFESSSKSTKRRKVQSIQEMYSELQIQQAFLSNLRAAGKIKLANQISKLLDDSDEHADETIITFTDDEALALIEDAKLSKHQYETIRMQAKARNANIFVPYKTLADAKERCYPPASAIIINDQTVTLKLQELLDHTVERLLKIPNIETCIISEDIKSMTLSLKYGCDGASDQSPYKQKLPDGMVSDESIFMFSMVPIRLESESKEIWKNPRPGSTKLCIPLAYQFAKETPELTRSEIHRIKEEINRLLPTKIAFGKYRCQVTHKMLLTMLDGKVAQNLTNTKSAATCYLCKTNPAEMNDLRRVMQKPVIEKNYDLGLSPLHAKLRTMQLILNVSYRLNFGKWQAKMEEEKSLMKANKMRIQQAFRKEMGLIIDIPKHGAGTSNDGNTARRFFRDPKLTSQITGIDVRLIERFSIILQVLSCSRKIDAVKFESYAFQTAELYVELYPWYYMSSTVHKILLHGARIIESFLIPIGLLSGETQEARNKDFKRFREFNTRKCSRYATNVDLTHKLLISSDAYLSHLRENLEQTDSILDPEALRLLIIE